jgi:inosose dehydratase
MIGAMERVADVARSHALSPVFHPHAGSFVEFRGEIERLLDESSLGLCIDTGHLAVAGVDPAELIDSHAGRVGHVHLKDVDPNVLHRVRAERLDYWTAVAEGLFCPIGCGLVDFPRVLDRLLQHDYTGCATLEQDRVAGTGDPQADVRASIKRLLACAPGRSLQASGTTHDTL